MGDNVFAVEGAKRTLYFERYETEHGSGTRLVRCVPKEDFSVFEVGAHYDASKPPNVYYRLAPSLRAAKAEFKKDNPWLDIRFVRKITEAEELNRILCNPMIIPI